MLLSKTSSRIKKFLSHRPSKDLEVAENSTAGEASSMKRELRATSWISKSRHSKDKSSLKRAVSSSATTRTHPASIPQPKTAHSSASSLCSCCDAQAQNTHSLSKAGTTSAPMQDALCLDLKEETPVRMHDQRWNGKFLKMPLSASSTNRLKTSADILSNPASNSTFDLLEALKMDPIDRSRTPTQESVNFPSSSLNERWSENVERLIRETDEAFEAVGVALAEAKAKRQEWDSTDEIPLIRPPPPRKFLSIQQPASVARGISASKPNQNKAKSKRGRLSDGRTISKPKLPAYPATSSNPRWRLTEVTGNVAEIFGGKIFSRMEVDEMLTPERMLQLRRENEAKRSSSETIQSHMTDETSTPSEPFNLEDLSSRIACVPDAQGLGSYLTPPSTAGSDVQLSKPTICLGSSREIVGKAASSVKDESSRISPDLATSTALQFRSMMFPSPPSSPPGQPPPRCPLTTAASRPRSRIALSTIPESFSLKSKALSISPRVTNSTTSTSPNSATIRSSLPPFQVFSSIPTRCPSPIKLQIRRKSSKGLRFPADEGTIEYQSTPYTLTTPTFRHGSIRLLNSMRMVASYPRSQLDLGSDIDDGAEIQKRAGNEMALDWTAFQMAISGGTGDYLMDGGGYGFGRGGTTDEEELYREAEDLINWWEGFGLELGGLHRMATTDETEKWNQPRTTAALRAEQSFGPPLHTAVHPTSTYHAAIQDDSLEVLGPDDFASGSDTHGSYGWMSLPQSPMDEFSPTSDGVPMGFNVAHDIKDFLAWDTLCVENMRENG